MTTKFKNAFVKISCLALGLNSFAQSENIKFLSSKAWNSSRWYLIAELKAGFVEFYNSKSNFRIPTNSRCRFEETKTEYIREEKSIDLEVLRSGRWILFEIQPSYNFDSVTLQEKGNEKCQFKIPLSYTFQGHGTGMQPYLFLSQNNSSYFGKKFIIESPPAQERADLQLDILLGYTMSSLKNVEAGAKKSLQLAPVALTRGEWVAPWFSQRFGASISLEQSLGTYGGAKNQTLNISEISTGLFWERIIPRLKGIQMRYFLRYLQRTEEDGSFVTSVPRTHEYMVFPVVGTTFNFYFSERLMSGFDLAYGVPTMMAGAGVKQDMILLRARLGRRLTSSLFFLVETSAKQIHSGGSTADLHYNLSGGFRLDL